MSPTEPEISLAIIDACRRGDRDAFRLVYEAYKDKVYSMALYFFHGDAATAADVTQQVFLKLMGNITQFRGDSSFATWLYRLVANACVDGMRRSRGRTRDADLALVEALPAAASQEDDIARAETADAVRSAIAALAPKIRLAILLRYFEGLSYEEMAAVLRCSPGTVASRLSRGHAILGRLLAPLRAARGERLR